MSVQARRHRCLVELCRQAVRRAGIRARLRGDQSPQRRSCSCIPRCHAAATRSPEQVPPILEFPMDATRTITSLLFSGGFARYSDIRFIFCHGGGMLVPIVQRLYVAAAQMKPEEKAVRLPNGPESNSRASTTIWRASVSIRPASRDCVSSFPTRRSSTVPTSRSIPRCRWPMPCGSSSFRATNRRRPARQCAAACFRGCRPDASGR